jgi:hypothetical protein
VYILLPRCWSVSCSIGVGRLEERGLLALRSIQQPDEAPGPRPPALESSGATPRGRRGGGGERPGHGGAAGLEGSSAAAPSFSGSKDVTNVNPKYLTMNTAMLIRSTY